MGRRETVEALALRFGRFTLLTDQRLLTSRGLPVRLGGKALDILIALVEYAGQFVSRDELITRIWGGRVVEEINLRVQVAALRRALGDDGRSDQKFILNLPAKGYCFVAPVTKAREAPAAAHMSHPVAGLPTSLSTLIGRESTIAELDDELREYRFITIVGPGGIGKSAVAIDVAAAAMSRYADGVSYVDLSGLADPRLASARIANALGCPPGEPQAGDIVESLRDRRLLLLLDGCEGVVDLLADLAEAVLAGAPELHLLATSREPLRVRGEQVHRLGPLAVPPLGTPASLESALSFSSVQLFVDLACAASGTFDPSVGDVPRMMEICRRLDGFPLALELAADRVEHLGLVGILEQLDNGFDLLTDGRRTDVPLQQSLRASFDWSVASMTAEEQRILFRLSVFAGGFSLSSGVRLASDGDPDEAVAELIGQLATKSLVSVESAPAGVRYRLLGATRAYARTRLRALVDHSVVLRKHAELVVDLLEAADEERANQSSQVWISRHASYLADVRTALDWLSSRSNEDALQMRLLAASVQLWFQLSAVAEYCDRVEEVLKKVSGPVSDADLIRVKASLGHARLHVFGPDSGALDAFEQGIGIADNSGKHHDHLMARWGLWLALCLKGRYSDALAQAEDYEKLTASVAAGAGIASDRMLLVSLHDVGRHADARIRGERALASILLGPRTGAGIRPQLEHEAIAKINLARVLWMQGMPDRSMAIARDAVDIARKSMHDLTSCVCLHGLFVVALWAGHRDEAREAALALFDLASQHRLTFWRAWARFDLDAVALVGGGSMRTDWREPICGIRQLELMATFSSDFLEPEVVLRAEQGHAPWCEPEVLRVRGCQALKLATERGRGQALSLFERALDLARVQGAHSWELRIATNIAELWDQLDEVPKATRLLTETLCKFTEGFATSDLRRAKGLLEKLRST